MALKRSVFELEGQIFDILEPWYLSFEICNQIENPSTVRPLAAKRRPAARAENFPKIDQPPSHQGLLTKSGQEGPPVSSR